MMMTRKYFLYYYKIMERIIQCSNLEFDKFLKCFNFTVLDKPRCFYIFTYYYFRNIFIDLSNMRHQEFPRKVTSNFTNQNRMLRQGSSNFQVSRPGRFIPPRRNLRREPLSLQFTATRSPLTLGRGEGFYFYSRSVSTLIKTIHNNWPCQDPQNLVVQFGGQNLLLRCNDNNRRKNKSNPPAK